ncbi:hypothetical protein Salat_0884600 [Sesamum alatum]|uniref:Uncharacterized protein n=1 Tax=Sesamum alatum TaxID=300844 RepID=A0AAE2CQW7_9LAMI|nr:hypothetical protein Salat_0884600 [Sesamum alatum]
MASLSIKTPRTIAQLRLRRALDRGDEPAAKGRERRPIERYRIKSAPECNRGAFSMMVDASNALDEDAQRAQNRSNELHTRRKGEAVISPTRDSVFEFGGERLTVSNRMPRRKRREAKVLNRECTKLKIQEGVERGTQIQCRLG